jgi:hypothetical protein
MAIITSGPLSLNAIHIEAGGSSGTSVTINDADIRGLTPAAGKSINTASGSSISFSDLYGASNAVIASGGTVSDVSGYRYHTFAGNGYNSANNFTFVISSIGNQTIEYIVIGPGFNGAGGGVQVGAEQLAAGSYSGKAGAWSTTPATYTSTFRGNSAGRGSVIANASGSPQNNPAGATENNQYLGTHWAVAGGGQGGAGGAGADATNPSFYHAQAGNGGPGYLWLDGKRYGAGRAGEGYDGDVGYGQFYPGTNGAGWGEYGSEVQGFSSVGAVIIRYPL